MPELAQASAGCGALHRPLRLSESGQQRPVLPLHFPRRARCRRDHDQRGDGGRGGARHRRAGAGGAVRHRRRSLRRADLAFGPRIPDSEAVRSAPDRARWRRRLPKRRWTAALRRVRSQTWKPIASSMARFVYHSGNNMKPVFAAAKNGAEARRLCGGRGRARAARGAGGGRRRARAPVLIGRPTSSAAHRRASACGSRLGRDLRGRQYSERSALSRNRGGILPARRRRGITQAHRHAKQCAAAATLIAAMLLRRGDVDAMLCGTVRHIRRASGLRARGDRPAPGLRRWRP